MSLWKRQNQFPFSFVARSTTTQTLGSLAVPNTMVYETVLLDRANFYNATTGVFTNTLGKGFWFSFDAVADSVDLTPSVGTDVCGFQVNSSDEIKEVRNTSTGSSKYSNGMSAVIFMEPNDTVSVVFGTNNLDQTFRKGQFSATCLVPKRSISGILSRSKQSEFDRFAIYQYTAGFVSIGTNFYQLVPTKIFDNIGFLGVNNRYINPFGKKCLFRIMFSFHQDNIPANNTTGIQLRINGSTFKLVDSLFNLSAAIDVIMQGQFPLIMESDDYFELSVQATAASTIKLMEVFILYLKDLS